MDLIDRDALEPFYESGTDPNDTYADMTFIRAEHIENAPAVNSWISVEDALPDKFIYVICAGKDGMAILRYNGDLWVDDVGCVYAMSAITHWMPLPEPPKGEQK